ncbi:MAG TPA: ATP-binding protein [Blastocatellia bacterium]|jgi:PAS domain S-box-containing protein
MRDRFVLDRKENILFINFAGVRIESRAQVDEFASLVRAAYESQGKRIYAVVNYEGTEIAPEIIDYYGERIKELYDRYSLSTVRYSSSGLTRSMLRYLGAAKDLESNTFATREEAIRAIREMDRRSLADGHPSVWAALSPRRGVLGKLILVWLSILAALLAGYFAAAATSQGETLEFIRAVACAAAAGVAVTGAVTAAAFFFAVIKPVRQMEGLARRLVAGAVFEPIGMGSRDEIGRLSQAFNEAARQLRRDIERLSGLYHISLMMGTGTGISKICELLTRKIARLLDAEMCVILLYDEREGCINAQLPAYGISDGHIGLLRSGVEEKNIATEVFKTSEPYMTNDAASDAMIGNAASSLLGVKTMLAVPLQAGERTFGTLEVMNKAGGFVEEDKRLVTIFASQAAHLLANAQLFEQVSESEERYRQIFESTLDGLYRSTPEGRLVTVNPALAGMLGYGGAEELIGANLFDDLFAERPPAIRLINELGEKGQALDVECNLRRASGAPMPARVSIRVVTDKADNGTYHLGIVKDITEQKRLSEQLIISERLAVIGELVAGVAHEVRNPLFGITTTLTALARRLEGREAMKPFLDVVMTEADHLNHLMEQLLEHSRPARLDGDGADISGVIREVLGEFGRQARDKHVAVSFEPSVRPPNLRFDRRKMHGVFANLLDNALQHTLPGGRINVVMGPAAGDPFRDGRREIHIEFSDTGAGIAPENLNKVFEPFFTTRAAGTGLGLAIVRKAIHDHGGTIAVYSELERGTTFIINLPLDSGDDPGRAL